MPLDTVEYVLNDKGLSTDIYPEMKCTPNHLSRFKNLASNIYVQSGLWANENGLGSALIQNDRMGIIESTSSNLFLVSNGVLYTPGLDSGATAGIMRTRVINLALSSGMKVYECNLTPQNLLVADEVFLTNVVQGLQWCGQLSHQAVFQCCNIRIGEVAQPIGQTHDSGLSSPRVQPSVGQVCEGVYRHKHQADKQYAPHHHRQVLLFQSIEQQESQASPPKNELHKNGSGEQLSEPSAGRRQHGIQCIPEHMAQQDL